MKLQRILAKDSRTANEEAVAKYGRDVLIVSTSRVDGLTELIVAVDVEPEATRLPVTSSQATARFESALRDQLGASAGAAPSADEPAASFVPAHTALLRSAQRAAQVIERAAAQRARPAMTQQRQVQPVETISESRHHAPAPSAGAR